jgi:hypothetical protein
MRATRGRQKHCLKRSCRATGKAARQRRWLAKPENRNYFREADNAARVREWLRSQIILSFLGGSNKEFLAPAVSDCASKTSQEILILDSWISDQNISIWQSPGTSVTGHNKLLILLISLARRREIVTKSGVLANSNGPSVGHTAPIDWRENLG